MSEFKLYFEDILQAISRIGEYTKGMVYDEFYKNTLVADGVVRNLEIIGEAVKKIPAEIRTKYPDVEWKKIAGLRDIPIHEYSGIDLKIVWDIVSNKLPSLKSSVNKILGDLK